MNGILAVEKPSGVSSLHVVLQIQAIFNGSEVFAADLAAMKSKVHAQLTLGTRWLASKIANRVKNTRIKVGHGGTLDPLATGVLIIGVGTGTKQLNYYLGDCTKTYETRAVLGQSTTTGDSEGEVVAQTGVEGVTVDALRKAAAKFVGKIKQTPPIYSALKVDGKPLYEYARKDIPVPKEIKARNVQVHLFVVHDFGPHDEYGHLKNSDAGDSVGNAVFNNPTLNDHELCFSDEFMSDPNISDTEKITQIYPILVDPSREATGKSPVFHATASVGSGTYIRSLVSDLGRAVGLLAFMAELVRTKQAEWEMGKNVFQISDFTDRDEKVWGPVLKKVLENGASVNLAEEFRRLEEEVALGAADEGKEREGSENEKISNQQDQGKEPETKRRKVEES